MGTFITAFIGHGFVQSTQHAPLLKKLPQTVRRRAIVVLFFTVIVSVLLLFGVLLAPDIIREGSDFVSRLKKDSVWVVVLEKMRHGLGCVSTAAVWMPQFTRLHHVYARFASTNIAALLGMPSKLCLLLSLQFRMEPPTSCVWLMFPNQECFCAGQLTINTCCTGQMGDGAAHAARSQRQWFCGGSRF